jgi:hypothetical protein
MLSLGTGADRTTPLRSTETDFMQIAGRMLFAQIMKDTLPGPLEYRVKRFGCVVVDITP